MTLSRMVLTAALLVFVLGVTAACQGSGKTGKAFEHWKHRAGHGLCCDYTP